MNKNIELENFIRKQIFDKKMSKEIENEYEKYQDRYSNQQEEYKHKLREEHNKMKRVSTAIDLTSQFYLKNELKNVEKVF